jgi:hypothetical protein
MLKDYTKVSHVFTVMYLRLDLSRCRVVNTYLKVLSAQMLGG